MFLRRLRETNPGLAAAAVRLHQEEALLANTYLLDLDALHANASAQVSEAARHGLSLYAMAKQFGRNPDALRTLAEAGIDRAVCVDLQGMEAVLRAGTRVGHVGHLVQPHRGSEDAVLAAEPEVVTLFDERIAARIGAAAVRAGRVQPILLRVRGPEDSYYFGHAGGFPLADIEKSAALVDGIDGLRVAGVTNFPCMAADQATRSVRPTRNFATLVEAADRLRTAGFEITQVNAPGTTSAGTFAEQARYGATHVEPGNGLHGTTPLHRFDPCQPEIPAIVYVSEVSHLDGDHAYVFAAGYYVDKVLGDYRLTALCGSDPDNLNEFEVETADAGAIHYYCRLRDARRRGVRVGDSVVFCFRPQVFVTRGRTQAVAGIHPRNAAGPAARLDLRGVYDGEARPVTGVA
ncbi:alanine racemase [Wenjunlia tyrosinilytica]|uniref:Amino-acid racemase n=1 Tax=Wenjunlia tyrosinilytica TaxID=1544741 RepID=A0A917ZV16_9ACTN|nr:alanine racemase [Wenjunlia tyrosinilytica]GGO91630.1 amino-acid racemase [Wenjunlia tyrosinilytica]